VVVMEAHAISVAIIDHLTATRALVKVISLSGLCRFEYAYHDAKIWSGDSSAIRGRPVRNIRKIPTCEGEVHSSAAGNTSPANRHVLLLHCGLLSGST
jgi:hypothetical protein